MGNGFIQEMANDSFRFIISFSITGSTSWQTRYFGQGIKQDRHRFPPFLKLPFISKIFHFIYSLFFSSKSRQLFFGHEDCL